LCRGESQKYFLSLKKSGQQRGREGFREEGGPLFEEPSNHPVSIEELTKGANVPALWHTAKGSFGKGIRFQFGREAPRRRAKEDFGEDTSG